MLYPFVKFAGQSVVRGLKYSMIIGVFFWSSHVLEFVAKQIVSNSFTFVVMESFYLLLRLLIFGMLIGLIYSKTQCKNA